MKVYSFQKPVASNVMLWKASGRRTHQLASARVQEGLSEKTGPQVSQALRDPQESG